MIFKREFRFDQLYWKWKHSLFYSNLEHDRSEYLFARCFRSLVCFGMASNLANKLMEGYDNEENMDFDSSHTTYEDTEQHAEYGDDEIPTSIEPFSFEPTFQRRKYKRECKG